MTQSTEENLIPHKNSIAKAVEHASNGVAQAITAKKI